MLRPIVLLLLLVACEAPREVAVRVSIPNLDSVETPVSGVEVLALPYDRDSILAQLAARARTPRPNTAPLDTAFAEFRGPFTAFATATYRTAKLRDSVTAMTARLESLSPKTPEYVALRPRVTAASESLRRLEDRRDRARAVLDSIRTRFVGRSDSLRHTIRAWEDSTYAGWDSIVLGRTASSHQNPHADTTDATGWARFTLPPGRWWIYTRSWDTGDPNAEWYWNVPVEGDTVLLSSKTGRHQARY